MIRFRLAKNQATRPAKPNKPWVNGVVSLIQSIRQSFFPSLIFAFVAIACIGIGIGLLVSPLYSQNPLARESIPPTEFAATKATTPPATTPSPTNQAHAIDQASDKKRVAGEKLPSTNADAKTQNGNDQIFSESSKRLAVATNVQIFREKDLDVTVEINKKSVLLGESFTYTVSVTYPIGKKPILPAPYYDFTPFEIAGYRIDPLVENSNGTHTFIINYFLRTFTLPSDTIPAFFIQPAFSNFAIMVAKPFAVSIKQTLSDNDLPTSDVNPFAQPMKVRNYFTTTQLFLLALLLVIVLSSITIVVLLTKIYSPKQKQNRYEALLKRLENLVLFSPSKNTMHRTTKSKIETKVVESQSVVKSQSELSKKDGVLKSSASFEIDRDVLRHGYYLLTEEAKLFLALRSNEQSAVGATVRELKKNKDLFFKSVEEENIYIQFFEHGARIKYSQKRIETSKATIEAENFLHYLLQSVREITALENKAEKQKHRNKKGKVNQKEKDSQQESSKAQEEKNHAASEVAN